MTEKCGAYPSGRGRVVVLGLDGATFTLLDPWLKAGLLPNLAALATNGYRGILRSTVPPVTPVAWSSMVTGVNPGRHGIFDFRRRDPGSYRFLPVLGKDRKAPGLWQYLTALGLRSIVINLPTSYPPERFNGIMVSGMDTPSSARDFVHPPLDLEELLGDKGPYIVETTFEPLASGDEEGWLDQMWHMTVARAELVRRLALSEEWSLLWVVFVFPDRLQHVMWKWLDARHPRHAPSRWGWAEETMLRFWNCLDQLLGELLDAFPDAHFLVVSDHGFGPYFKLLRVNRLLEKMGYVRFDDAGGVDWTNTRAFAVGSHSGIYVNLKGREPLGAVDPRSYESFCAQLISELRSVVEEGEPLFEYVLHRTEAYSGPYVEMAPDVVIAGRSYKVQVSDGFVHEVGARAEVFDELMLTDSGHHPDGIVLAFGPKVSPGSAGAASIMDVAPTAMYLAGVPLPPDLDGRLMVDALEASALDREPPSLAPYELQMAASGQDYTDEQMEQVLDRLRDLGYIE